MVLDTQKVAVSIFFDPLVWYLADAAMHGTGYGAGKYIPHIPKMGNSYGFGFGYGLNRGLGRGYGSLLPCGAGAGYGNNFNGEAYGNGLISYIDLNRAKLF